MQDFPANSQKAKTRSEMPTERPEKIERVTSAEAVRRKRGLGRQFKDTFIGGDARGSAEYVVVDILIPAVRDMFAEAATAGIERLIYGEGRRRRNGPPSGYNNVGHVDYRGMGMR